MVEGQRRKRFCAEGCVVGTVTSEDSSPTSLTCIYHLSSGRARNSQKRTDHLQHPHGTDPALRSDGARSLLDGHLSPVISPHGRGLEPAADAVRALDDGDARRGRERRQAVSERERGDARA